MHDTETLQRNLIESGDPQSLGQLMLKYQDRLERIVRFRMDPRLVSRLDAADVLQEGFLEATKRIGDFRSQVETIPFFLWLRFIVLQKLTQMHRFHLGALARDATRDVSLYQTAPQQGTSIVLAAQLLGQLTSPSGAAMREENRRRIELALSHMDSVDREVLALRHFEQLSNNEVARLLDITPAAASNRYIRAIRRLKLLMDELV
ncbi:MAG: sigma-70 family RNA polymerase sigma factor [Planctomycetales bacterium]|nr:sigma-70 family RNA polymerase sigma factor [Planctomycetales bacterium]